MKNFRAREAHFVVLGGAAGNVVGFEQQSQNE
jgi:hypothetical protein